MKKVLLLCAGKTPPGIAAKYGEKLAWFRHAVDGLDVVFEQRLIFNDDPVSIDEGDAMIITGSDDSVLDQSPWMLQLEGLIRAAARQEKPLLGICFGHQIIAKALGGSVVRNPRGWEVGSHRVQLTPAGRTSAIFEGFPEEIVVYETHEDIVDRLHDEADLYASNSKGIQAFGYGSSIWGVQFHPEFSYDVICEYSKLSQSQGIQVDCEKITRATYCTKVIGNFINTIV